MIKFQFDSNIRYRLFRILLLNEKGLIQFILQQDYPRQVFDYVLNCTGYDFGEVVSLAAKKQKDSAQSLDFFINLEEGEIFDFETIDTNLRELFASNSNNIFHRFIAKDESENMAKDNLQKILNNGFLNIEQLNEYSQSIDNYSKLYIILFDTILVEKILRGEINIDEFIRKNTLKQIISFISDSRK
jgi:hypothetical protein